MMWRFIGWMLLASTLASGSLHAQGRVAPPEGNGPNNSITRWAEGTYRYLADGGKRVRGIETFRLHVHPDGTRTLMMWHDLFARNSQYSVMLRVAADFRPLQAFANYWTDKGYKGSVFITVTGHELQAIANGPVGMVTQTLAVPEGLSLGTHPVAGDGWHMWHVDPDGKGVQKSGALYGIESGSDLSKPVLGSLAYISFEVLGEEAVTVPAGTFPTTRYRLAGRSDVWVLMPDRIVIKMSNSGRGYDYVLTEFKAGNNAG
jgi:hypothetical protein